MAGLGGGSFTFGLTLSRDVVAYVDGIKNRSAELSSLEIKINHLLLLFNAVDDAMTRIQRHGGPQAAAATDCLSAVKTELAALEKLLERLTGNNGSQSRLKSKMKETARTLTHPFDRQKLRELEDHLDEGILALTLALQNVNMGDLGVVIDKLEVIETKESALEPKIEAIASGIATLKHPITEICNKLPHIEDSLDTLETLGQSLSHDTRVLSTQVVDSNVLNRKNLSEIQEVREAIRRVELGLQSLQKQQLQIEAQQKSLAEIENQLKECCIIQTHRVSRRRTKEKQVSTASTELLVRRLASKPGNLKALCDNAALDHSSQPDNGTAEPPTACDETQMSSAVSLLSSKLTCICPQYGGLKTRVEQQSIRWMGFPLLQTTSKQEHLPGCPKGEMDENKSSQTTSFRLHGLTRVLGAAIELTLSVASGAGGWSISPGMSYRPAIHGLSSPAYRIFWTLVFFCRNYSRFHNRKTKDLYHPLDKPTYERFAATALEKLAKVYTAKTPRASPMDIDENSRSLLWYFIFNMDDMHILSHSTIRHWFLTLMNWGVPARFDKPYDRCFIQRTFYYTDIPSKVEMLDMMLSSPGDHTMHTQWRIRDREEPAPLAIYVCKGPIRNSVQCAEAWGYGPLSLAVLAEDHRQVETLLKKYPSMIKEVNCMGQTPLHIAADKPACLRVLVKYADANLINQTDNLEDTALLYAMVLSRHRCRAPRPSVSKCSRCSCADCVVILLQADSAFFNDNEFAHASYVYYSTKRCWSRYLRHLKDRRDRLKKLALETLPFTESSRLGLHESSILDSEILNVINRLDERYVPIPGPLQINYYSPTPYFDIYVNVEIAERFYNLGFHEVGLWIGSREGAEMNFHWTSTYNMAKMYEWLFKRGADFSQRVTMAASPPKPQHVDAITSGHLALARLGESLVRGALESGTTHEEKSRPHDHFLEPIKTLWSFIPLLGIADNCPCICSPGGCTALTYFLKGFKMYPRIFLFRMYPYEFFLIFRIATITGWRIEEHLAAMRIMTFEALEMVHTCCQLVRNWEPSRPTDEEIEATQYDTPMLELFESLVAEFEEGLRSRVKDYSGQPAGYTDFWEKFWWPRMDVERKILEEDKISKSQKQGAEALGVVFEDPTKVKDESKPVPGKNPYKKHEIDYWYKELELIAPE